MHRQLSVTLATGMLALVALLSGCGQQLGALLYHSGMIPEEKTKSQFKLTQNKLAILVDDPAGVLPSSALRDDIRSSIVTELTSQKACGTVATSIEMARVERTNRDFDNMSIRAVGEQVQAEQVLFVQIQSFTVGDEAKMGVYKGRAKVLVKVCSTDKKPDVRLWPLGGDGQAVEVTQPSEQLDTWKTNDKAGDVYAKAISERLGKRIAMLFYSHGAEGERDLAAGRAEKPK